MILYSILREVYRKIRPIVVNGKDNIVEINKPRHKKDFTVTICGNYNKIIIHKNCRLDNTSIVINGNNNEIEIEENVKFRGPCKILMEGQSKLIIKSETGIRGVEFNMRDANINIGKKCMFSYGILLRNHDSHKVIDLNLNEITNLPNDIVLGDHVWVAQNSKILKGVNIGNNSIVAFGSVVTKDCPANSLIAGNPSKIVKNNINWDY